jgi:replicative DNA helicase
MEYSNSGLAYDSELEEAALGALLILPDSLQTVLSETKITTSSFYWERNKEVFKSILKLFEQGTPATEALVSSELNGTVPPGYVGRVVENAPAPGNVLHYAKRLVELENWRARREAATKLVEATGQRVLEAFSKARALLDDDEIKENSITTPEDSAKEFKDFLEQEQVEAFELPYKRFNERMAGGLRRKQMTLVGGWSSHGKSIVVDQFLEHFSKAGHNCHLYMNEMGKEDRIARSISRNTGVCYQKLLQHEISESERKSVESVLDSGCPYFSITECAGWSIHELAYDIKSRNFDVIAVDILHLFDYDSEIELARISRLLNRTAKQANCHIIATVHLNEFRVNDTVRPRPVPRDIRGSGMLKNDADNVMFIYRNQHSQTGDPLPPSWIYTSKVRNGQMGSISLMFDEEYFRFKEVDHGVE